MLDTANGGAAGLELSVAASIEELLAHDGQEFIARVYLTLLGRDPDQQGSSFYLGSLKSSTDKKQIIYEIGTSLEARHARCIPGKIKSWLRLERLKRLPLANVLFRSRQPSAPLIAQLEARERRLVEHLEQQRAVMSEVRGTLEQHTRLLATLEGLSESDLTAQMQSFDPAFYLRSNPDVAAAGINPYEHWVVAGHRERRKCTPDPVLPSPEPMREIEPAQTYVKERLADGEWEWDDYEPVKGRIGRADLERRARLTVEPLSILNLSEAECTSIARTLRLPAAPAKPAVSIIIPVFNNLKLTLECLASIARFTDSTVSYEVLIADDASSDDSATVIPTIANVRYLRNDTNLGFLRNCNRALPHANGEYVLFLNNDVQVTENWLRHLRETFDTHWRVGAVGPRFLYPSGHLQEAGARFRPDASAQMIGLNEDPTQPRFSYTRRTDYVSGACLMMPTALAMRLGGFSEEYLPCYCEDADLCLRIQREGYFVYVNPASTLMHHLSRTTGAIDSQFKQRAVTKNVAVLKKNWYGHFDKARPRVIALYLPQFHPFPENERWWGDGFTEWTNVTKARPNFAGHYQPRLPSDLGYYDLRLADVMRRQAELAKRYGVHGFCFYYYWFAGKRLMETPVDNLLRSPDIDLPFCLCWANENWSRRWDGKESDVLMAQAHSDEDDLSVIGDLMKYFRDPRYIRVDGRPVLLVYRVGLFPDFRKTAERWRAACREHDIGEIYLVGVESFELVHDRVDPASYGCDAAVEFPPHGMAETKPPSGKVLNPEFIGHVADYRDIAVRFATRELPAYTRFPAVMPGWDNTARRQNESFCFEHATPGAFQAWLEVALEKACEQNYGDERMVFVNAWNEWAEGAYLEPDRVFGHSFLDAVKNATAAELLRKSEP